MTFCNSGIYKFLKCKYHQPSCCLQGEKRVMAKYHALITCPPTSSPNPTKNTSQYSCLTCLEENLAHNRKLNRSPLAEMKELLARCPAGCLYLWKPLSLDLQKLRFVNPRQMLKLFIYSLRLRKKEVGKSRFMVYCDFPFKAGGSE